MMLRKPSLGLAIPVHNDPDGLKRLFETVRNAACFSQLIVVDDGSTPALQRDQLVAETGLSKRRVVLHHNDTATGPGQARNMALKHVRTSHLLYFDADDVLTPEMPRLWRSLEREKFDFCLFRHTDSRQADAGKQGQMPWDERLLQKAGCAVGALTDASQAAWPLLAQTANYPWNKIYRTAFLRRYNLKCAQTEVHEDILLHWMGFLHARRVLVSDRVAAFHYIHSEADRQTNRRDQARLEAIPMLEDLAKVMRSTQGADSPLFLAYLRFVIGLFEWIRGNLSWDLHPDLSTAITGFAHRHLTGETRAALQHSDPETLVRFDRQGHAPARTHWARPA